MRPKKTPETSNNGIKSTKYIKLFYTYRIDGRQTVAKTTANRGKKISNCGEKTTVQNDKPAVDMADPWDKIAWQAKN